MTKVVIDVLAAFEPSANEQTFILIFGGEDIAAHIYHKFVYECQRDVSLLIPSLVHTNRGLLYHYLDKLVSAQIIANVKQKVTTRAVYERDEKQRLAALEVQKAFDSLPEKARKAINA